MVANATVGIFYEAQCDNNGESRYIRFKLVLLFLELFVAAELEHNWKDLSYRKRVAQGLSN